MKGFVLGVVMVGFMGLSVTNSVAEPVGPKLTPRLQNLLADEMQQVAQATADLAMAIAAGDHSRVMELGSAVRDSFILKQSLTEQDKKDLMAAVPPAFVALDRRFHETAGKLAHAAEMGDSELQGFYFANMLEACVSCHSHYAADRFPGLQGHGQGQHDH